MSGRMASRISKLRLSLASPPVRWKAIGKPSKSVFRWILVENPPRERPRAWPSCPLYGMARPPPPTAPGSRVEDEAMSVDVLGIDLGKNSCSVVGLDPTGRVVLRRRMRRESIVALAAKLSGCVVAMEACCGAHHLGRLLAAQGHEVRLMSPEYVRPYVKAQKNDDRDAEAIAEAATRPTMRFGPLKTEAQLDVQVLHRVRDRLVSQRTALTNQMRSILLERGIAVPQGRRRLLDALQALSDQPDGSGVGPRVRLLLGDMLDQWRGLDRRIAALDDEFAAMARNDPAARRLATIPGVGVLNATALVAAIGDGRTFSRGRDLSAWLGIVARQASTGGRPKLLGITKRGRQYLRARLCPRCPERRRRSAAGCAACSVVRMATRLSSRWRASWCGSPGHCCARRPRSPPVGLRKHRSDRLPRRARGGARARGAGV